MRKLALLAVVLCTSACNQKDTEVGRMWPRTVEPRLAGARWQQCHRTPLRPDRFVESVRCSEATVEMGGSCDRIENTHAEAVRMLALKPRCTDQALAALETFARADPAVLSDVAAAYYVRAQRDDQASDFLSALDAAARAAEARPADPAAHFNLALVQEAIGLKEQAMASWARVKDDGSGWATEAKERRARLQRELAEGAATDWEHNRKQLPDALRTGNAAEIARLIAPYPRSALVHFEEILPDGDLTGLYAKQLAARLGDPYPLHLRAAAPNNREGHRLLREGKKQFAQLQFTKAALAYANAARLLQRGESPAYLAAKLGHAMALSNVDGQLANATAMLGAIEREPAARRYPYFIAGIRSNRGYLLFAQSRYVESFAEYDAALELYKRLDDVEMIAGTHRSKAGNYRLVGQYELAWIEAMQALRYMHRVIDIRIRHTTLGEASTAALTLGNAPAALRLQELIFELLRKELKTIPPERVEAVQQVIQLHFSVAHRERARIAIVLRDYQSARRDLNEAMRLRPSEEDENTRRILQGRMSELEGQALMNIDRRRAADAFTAAINRVGANELRTFRASLLAQRAEARLLERSADAERDLQAALTELRAEEARVLAGRKLGEGESIWSAYFARFDETYDRLIGLLLEQGREAEAFAHSERARAFEPLNLVLKLPFAPDEFRKLTAGENPMARDAIQRSLPPGTFLLHYAVTDDRTYTWVISREAVRLVQQEVDREDIARWTAALQRAGRHRDEKAFERGLYAPYHELLEKPLQAIAAMNGGRKAARLVFIPDGAMHGLPFAALRGSESQPHLIRDSVIEMAGSATLYVFSLMRDRALKSPAPSALLIGDPAFERLAVAHRLGRLPAAAEEVEEIRPLYEPRVDVRTGDDATVPAFLELARDKTIVHFAGHSIVDPQEPSRSLLLMAPSPERSGAVQARELLTQLKLDRTRLVVLAACSSAGGLPVGPEGVAPLVRPLLGAGVPAVIGSLWDVDDTTAKAVFVSFHRQYRKGSDAASALRAAQVALLDSGKPGLRSALAWTPFQVIGHASSPFAAPQKMEEHLAIRHQNPLLGDARIHP